ncbi:alpha/beta hydrolase [Desulfococcus sp.]|uniref:alpha/beta hydrolase n=1 Tax=Desulfococcus sp. TaxID=2025834 RepID=UPI003D108C7A
MTDMTTIDYGPLDRPEITAVLFHPRGERPLGGGDDAPGITVSIPVEEGVEIGGRFHIAGKTAPNILFFHGNGEIVSDYDDLGPVYNRMGINFLPVDYRGYGRSTGSPTVTAMMRDCHIILGFTLKWLSDNGCTGPLAVMGRSLGSASALELAACYEDGIHGVIIESGFAWAGPLLALLGVDVAAVGFEEKKGFRNIDKIRSVSRDCLIIHAERDHIIPSGDGRALYEACGAVRKRLLMIPGADHNDLLYVGYADYMDAVQTFIKGISGSAG